MKTALRSILGAFRITRRRALEAGQPGITVWTDAGERAAQEVGRAVVDLAHRNECAEHEAARRLREMVADGKIDPQELAELQRLPANLEACAERDHDIGEIADPGPAAGSFFCPDVSAKTV
jgi:hypothetical protein